MELLKFFFSFKRTFLDGISPKPPTNQNSNKLMVLTTFTPPSQQKKKIKFTRGGEADSVLHAMYKTGALIVSSSKLLLPALAAAARLVTGVLYVPLDCVAERMAALAGSEGAQERLGSSSRARENEGIGKKEEQALHYEEKYLHETSQQVNEIDKLMGGQLIALSPGHSHD